MPVTEQPQHELPPDPSGDPAHPDGPPAAAEPDAFTAVEDSPAPDGSAVYWTVTSPEDPLLAELQIISRDGIVAALPITDELRDAIDDALTLQYAAIGMADDPGGDVGPYDGDAAPYDGVVDAYDDEDSEEVEPTPEVRGWRGAIKQTMRAASGVTSYQAVSAAPGAAIILPATAVVFLLIVAIVSLF